MNPDVASSLGRGLAFVPRSHVSRRHGSVHTHCMGHRRKFTAASKESINQATITINLAGAF